MTDIRAVFVGGPIDGQVMTIPAGTSAWTVAQAPGIPALVTADMDWPRIMHHHYRLKLVYGWPSITDDGLTRYEYVGCD